MAYPYDKILFSNKMRQTMCNKLDESQNFYAEWMKPEKDGILHNFIYIKF